MQLTARERATVRAAVLFWSRRNLPPWNQVPAQHDCEAIAAEGGPALDAEEQAVLLGRIGRQEAQKQRVVVEFDEERLKAVHSSLPIDVSALDWHLGDFCLSDGEIARRDALDLEAKALGFKVEFP